MDKVREVLDQSATDKLKTIPLSNDTYVGTLKKWLMILQQTIIHVQASDYYVF